MSNHQIQTGRRAAASAFVRNRTAKQLGAGLIVLPLLGVTYAGVSQASGTHHGKTSTHCAQAVVGEDDGAGPGDATAGKSAAQVRAYKRYAATALGDGFAGRLARVWGVDLVAAKIRAGQNLLDAGPGYTLITDGERVGEAIMVEQDGPNGD
jgi:hypothetical protein